jgi:hypothetical protein
VSSANLADLRTSSSGNLADLAQADGMEPDVNLASGT